LEEREGYVREEKDSMAATKAFVSDQSSKITPFGSYTGHSKDKDGKPVQDADDL
jgi:hypothetical protein